MCPYKKKISKRDKSINRFIDIEVISAFFDTSIYSDIVPSLSIKSFYHIFDRGGHLLKLSLLNSNYFFF